MRERRSQLPDVLWIAALAAGCAALFARPLATGAGWGVVVAVGVLGIAVPVGPPVGRGGRAWWWGVTSVGVAAFAAARMLAVHTPAPGTLLALAATGVAAIAEEAFFRRFFYGWLARWATVWRSPAPRLRLRPCTSGGMGCGASRSISLPGRCLAGSGGPPGAGIRRP